MSNELEVRNYTDIYSIKDYMINVYGPKHFNMEDVNRFSDGLMGYTTEIAAVTTEDAFLAMNTHMKEMFISQASHPETIGIYAAQLDVDGEIATAAELRYMLFIKRSDIHEYGTKKDTEIIFTVDKAIDIVIDGVIYSLDYDVVVTATPYRNDYTYTSRYNMDHPNSISSIRVPYLNTSTGHIISNTEYVAIEVHVHQVIREITEENVLSVDRINFSSITINHSNQFCGIDVLYQEPGSKKFIPLQKRVKDNTPVTDPFFFYRIVNEDTIEISFSPHDRYFRPEFNSLLHITIHTTNGEQGNFKSYNGDNTIIITKSDKYDYLNGSVVLFGYPIGSAKYGLNRRTLEDIRDATIEKQATCDVYNTEEDLQLYFRNYSRRSKNFMLFVKRRDDLMERLFSAFTLMRNDKGDFYRTNTLGIEMTSSDYDSVDESTKISTLRPGRIFKYQGDKRQTVDILPADVRSENYVDDSGNRLESDFVYTNPFLMLYHQNPSTMNMYLTSVDSTHGVRFRSSSPSTKTHILCNTLSVYRDSVNGDDEYVIKVTLRPTTPMELHEGTSSPILLDKMKVLLSFVDNSKDTYGYMMETTGRDIDQNMLFYETRIKVNDVLTNNGKMNIVDSIDIRTGEEKPIANVPMTEANLSINIFVSGEGADGEHHMSKVEGLSDSTLINVYDVSDEPINFVTPMLFMRCRSKYIGRTDDGYSIRFDTVPLIAQDDARSNTDILSFCKEIMYLHDYLLGIVLKKTTNFTIDMKFYNTYGRANNFTVDEKEMLLDRTNIGMHFSVRPTIGANTDELIRDIRSIIKNYVEDINNVSTSAGQQGYNAVYISTIIKDIQTKFADESLYIKFHSINDYPSSVQIVENRTMEQVGYDSGSPMAYVPEYLSIRPEDIKIDIITR